MAKKLLLVLSFLLILTNSVFAVEKPQRYMPYPIVFVSGIGTKSDANIGMKGSPSHEWPDRRVFNELKKYFLLDPEIEESMDSKYEFEDKDIEKLKLQPGEKPILQFLFYDAQQATLATNADLLKDRINKILSPDGGYYKPDTYTYAAPCDTPKVILVCHSLGGLIARKMLVDNHDNIRDKVAAVFFIGTQQEGSPVGVVAYFLPKEIIELREDIDDINALIDGAGYLRRRALINVRQKEESKITGNLRLMRWAETEGEVPGFPMPGLYVSTRDSIDNAQLREALADTGWLAFLEDELPEVSEKGVVKGTLINSEFANSYRHTFEAYSFFNGPFGTGIGAKVVRNVPENGPLTYGLSEGVFSNPSVDRNIGDMKAHAIAGNLNTILGLGICAAANSLMGWDNFSVVDYSCVRNHFWDNGDGFSNLASQEAIVPSANVHEIIAAHTSVPLVATGELDHPDTPAIILQAIDDKPVIESIDVVAGNGWIYGGNPPTFNYVRVKVKDYLLADIEIVDMIVNGNKLDLANFTDPITGANVYKPYLKYNKDFLKERSDTNAPIYLGYGGPPISYLTLKPGEFWVMVNSTTIYNAFVKVRNPAGKETFKEIILPRNMTAFKLAQVTGNIGIPFSDVSKMAYDSLLSSNRVVIYDENAWPYNTYFLYHIGTNAHSSYKPFEVYQEDGTTRTEYQYTAAISMFYGSWVAFRFDSPPDQINPFKLHFISSFLSQMPSQNEGFNILVCHDTSNRWPPDRYSNADNLLLSSSINPLSSQYIAIDVDPIKDIGPDGWYVLQFRPDFTEYNCIPDPAVREFHREAGVYPQSQYIVVEPKE